MASHRIRPAAPWRYLSNQLEALSIREHTTTHARRWRALHTTPQQVETEPPPVPTTPIRPAPSANTPAQELASSKPSQVSTPPAHSPIYDVSRTPLRKKQADRGPFPLTDSIKANLENLRSQPPFYASVSIHGRPYLVTVGDQVRLPFLMHGVMPGDVLRLDRITTIGSRDWTLVGSKQAPKLGLAATQPAAEPVIGRTDGLASTSAADVEQARTSEKRVGPAYLDERLFVCRATVMGTETEPLRIMEKTKRRQRHVKHVKSKHRYTVIRISEITPRSLEDIKSGRAA